ncbi:MAG: NAD(P)-dependent oxidoreductase [Bradyrhizobiaceae bacterium]|nr:NAD(P)-dependent oxidoreductase [Bradyrhizobiaceae bacterium]
MQIGFIGLGVMGSRMAKNLAKAGHDLTVYDADPDTTNKVAADIGGRAAASPREAAAASEIVITMLPNGQIVRDVVFGESGLAAGFQAGAMLLDTSSAEPWITRETAERLAQQNVDMVDAPVSGAEEGARTATLVFMCGGSEEGLARARPLLELMGKHVFHVGPISAGHTMKAINNVTTALSFLCTAEALLVGKSYGLNAKAMLDVMNVSTGYSFATQNRFLFDVITRRFQDQFKLDLMLKDMGIARQLAEAHGLPAPMMALGTERWQQAVETLGRGAVTTEVVRFVEREMGVELKD